MATRRFACALDVDPEAGRAERAPWDLRTADETTVEVETAAYVQAWAPSGLSPGTPRYSGLRARLWEDRRPGFLGPAPQPGGMFALTWKTFSGS